MEYSTPHKRPLHENEKVLLHFLFSNEKPEWNNLINKLKVIARCGCGKCPTVMFGFSFDDKVKPNEKLLIDYAGVGKNGDLIGVSLFGNEETPTELEFYSIDGQNEVKDIPRVETLKLLT